MSRLCRRFNFAVLFCALTSSGAAQQATKSEGPEEQILKELTQTRLRGAELYNDGESVACVRLFKKALQKAHVQLRDYVDLQKAIATAFELADSKSTPDAQALVFHDVVAKLASDLKRLNAFAPLAQLAERADQGNELDRSARLYRRALDLHRQQKNATADLERIATAHGALGRILLKKRQYPDAARELSEAIRLNAEQAPLWVFRAKAYAKMGDFPKMASDYGEAIRLKPAAHEYYDEFAWHLATSPDPLIRDGKRSLSLARKACELSRSGNPWYFDTVAAAHAELDEFDEATRVLRRALASPDDLTATQINSLRLRLAQYETGKPTRTIEILPAGVDFALKIILPDKAKIRMNSVEPAPESMSEWSTTPFAECKAARAVLQGKASADESSDATRIVKLELSFPVKQRLERFDLEYRLKRGQTRWVDARLIVDEWTRTLESLEVLAK